VVAGNFSRGKARAAGGIEGNEQSSFTGYQLLSALCALCGKHFNL
jgi:hypothetical protein